MSDSSDGSQSGRRLNQYDLIREVGSGRTGTVYEALDRGLRRVVAVKILAPELASSPDRVWRFIARAAMAARVVHHNVASVFFIGQEHSKTFCAGEFAAGGTLAANRNRIQSSGVGEAMDVAAQILEGLRTAHALGVIHGNLHDGNVLFDEGRRRVVITDFEGESAGSRDPSLPGAGMVHDLRDVGELLQSLTPLTGDGSPGTASKLEGFRRLIEGLKASGTKDGFASANDALEAVWQLCPEIGSRAAPQPVVEEAVELSEFIDDESAGHSIAAGAKHLSIEALPLLPESVVAFDQWTRAPRPHDSLEESTLIERAISDVRDRLDWLDQFDRSKGNRASDRISSAGGMRDSLDDALHRLVTRQEAMRQRPRSGRSKDGLLLVKILAIVALVGWILWLIPNALDVSTRLEIDSMLAKFSIGPVFYPAPEGYPPQNGARIEEWGPDLSWVPERLTRPPARQLRISASEWARGLEFCPDRSIVATCYSEGSVQLALAETGQNLHEFMNFTPNGRGRVRAISFSPDGRRLAVGSDGRYRALLILDVASGRVAQDFSGRFTEAHSVGFSFDGKFLGAVIEAGDFTNPQRSIVLFDCESGQVAERFPESDRATERIRFSPTKPLVAIFGTDRPITLSNYAEMTTRSLTTGAHNVAFSPDGRQLAVAVGRGQVQIWDLQDLSKPREFYPDQAIGTSDVKYSPDGRYLAVIGGGVCKIWDWSKNEILRYFVTPHGLVSFSSDGRFLATAGNDELNPLVWDVSDLTGSTTPADRSGLAKDEEACRRCRHLASIRQADGAAFRNSLETAARSFPVVEVQGNATPAQWQELTLNSAGFGFDGVRFKSPLSEPADLHWAFNVSVGFIRSGMGCVGGPQFQLERYEVESNLLIPEIRLPRNNGVHFQHVSGGRILPGKEYVIWFRHSTTDPVTLSCALHAGSAAPLTGNKATSSEIATAMGWKTPFARSAQPYSDKDRFQRIVLDVFDSRPRLPFSSDLYRPAPLDDYLEPPDVDSPRRTILRRPQP